MELQTDGHIAKVQCVEVRCAMTDEFFAYYLTSNISRRLLLAVMNPNKMRTCQFLVEYHKARGDKVYCIFFYWGTFNTAFLDYYFL
jgi:DNA excision repair protein ERCC-3